MNINEWVKEVHGIAAEKGWHDGKHVPIERAVNRCAARICLIHSELSEMLEALRDNDLKLRFTDAGKPEGLPSEAADVAIRLFDFCGEFGIDLEEAIEAKHAFNKSRPHRHGGKLL